MGIFHCGEALTSLLSPGLMAKRLERVKILGVGDLAVALHVKAHKFSKTAAAKIEAAGGKVETIPVPARGPKPKKLSKRQEARRSRNAGKDETAR